MELAGGEIPPSEGEHRAGRERARSEVKLEFLSSFEADAKKTKKSDVDPSKPGPARN